MKKIIIAIIGLATLLVRADIVPDSVLKGIKVDGKNAGRYEDVIANYPARKTELDSAITTKIKTDAVAKPEETKVLVDTAKTKGVAISKADEDAVKAEIQRVEDSRKTQDLPKGAPVEAGDIVIENP